MDARVTEFHCIMPIANIGSVLQHGIVCHELASKLRHKSVALQAVQDTRSEKIVPRGRKLHQYANLYFHARNPMMYKRHGYAASLCVLQIGPSVLDIDGVVLSDQNAASKYVRFLSVEQWQLLDFDDIYAHDWRHPDDQIRRWRHASRKCAECLVPDRVSPDYFTGAYVVDDAAAGRLQAEGFDLPITEDADLFFH